MSERNVSRYWLSPLGDNIALLRADLCRQEFPTHFHDALVIAVTESGGALVNARGTNSTAAPDTILVTNPWEPHSVATAGNARWRYREFYLRAPALKQLQEELQASSPLYFERNGLPDEELAASLLDLHLALEAETDRFALEEKFAHSMGLLYARYGRAKPELPPNTKNRYIVSKVLDTIEARHAEVLHLGDLADQVGLTQFQLIGLFKSVLGLTPYSMLTQIRLVEACKLLVGGDDICDVAVAVGFYDQSALTKHFKRRFAITPAQFVQARAS